MIKYFVIRGKVYLAVGRNYYGGARLRYVDVSGLKFIAEFQGLRDYYALYEWDNALLVYHIQEHDGEGIYSLEVAHKKDLLPGGRFEVLGWEAFRGGKEDWAPHPISVTDALSVFEDVESACGFFLGREVGLGHAGNGVALLDEESDGDEEEEEDERG